MKKIHFLGCLLLTILIAACTKQHEIKENVPTTPSGEFIFEGKTYDLHYCSIRRNESYSQSYEALLYSYDKTVRLKISFINYTGGITTGNYENFGLTVDAADQRINARLSLCHIPEDTKPSGFIYVVEFEKNANGTYDLRIYPKESPDETLVYWSGKLS